MAFKDVDPSGADKLIKAGHTYVDVRTAEEHAAGHVPGAVCVAVMNKGAGGMAPNPNFISEMTKKFPKDAKLVVGCQAGKRSLVAVQQLEAAGYTNLSNLAGGYASWVSANMPVEM